MSTVGSYVVRIGPLEWDQYEHGPISLVRALQELRGTGCVEIVRADGTLVVPRAGSDSILSHAPSGHAWLRGTGRRIA